MGAAALKICVLLLGAHFQAFLQPLSPLKPFLSYLMYLSFLNLLKEIQSSQVVKNKLQFSHICHYQLPDKYLKLLTCGNGLFPLHVVITTIDQQVKELVVILSNAIY